MITQIERFLYEGGGKHAVVEVRMSEARLVLKVAEWTELSAVKTVEFTDFKIVAMDVDNNNHEDFNLPWDLIALDCAPIAADRWRFELHSASLMYRFESAWPRWINREADKENIHVAG